MRGHVRRGHMGNSLRSSRISNPNGLSFLAQSIAIVHFFNSDHLELMADRCVAVILVDFFVLLSKPVGEYGTLRIIVDGPIDDG